MDALTLLNRPDLSTEQLKDAFASSGVTLTDAAAAELVEQRASGAFTSEQDVLARNQLMDAGQLAAVNEAMSSGALDDMMSPQKLLNAYLQQPELTPADVDRAFERSGPDIGPAIGQSLLQAAQQGELNSRDDFLAVPLVGPKRLDLMLDAAESGQLFATQDDTQPLYFLADDAAGVGRTIERTNCNIGNTRFGINFYGRRTQVKNGLQSDVEGAVTKNGKQIKRRLAALRPELRMNTNTYIGVAVVADVRGDYPGTQIVEVFRNVGADVDSPIPARQTDATLARTVSGATDLADLRKRSGDVSDIRVRSPKVELNEEVTEVIAIRYTWQPDKGDPCSIVERMVVVWVGEAGERGPRISFPKGSSSTNPHVVVGTTVQRPEEEPDDEDNDNEDRGHYTISAFTFFPLEKKSTGCCGVKDLDHAVIQFVRHSYKFKSQKLQHDQWSLDIVTDEISSAQKGQDFDPTYTLDPCDRQAKAFDKAKTDADKAKIKVPPPVVFPGADTNLKRAVSLVDAPGFSPELYDQLVRRGESFSWHFYSFLVCKLGDCKASAYLENARVQAYLQWEFTVTFKRKGDRTTVEVKKPKRVAYKKYSKCLPFKDVLAQLDKKRSKSNTKKEGTLADGFANPRDHEIGVKRRRSAR